MASSQEMVLSQEMVSASKESVSQGSASQDMVSMPSQDSTTNATILDGASGIPMEDETCLEGSTLRCTPEEERALFYLLFNESID